MSKRNLAVFGFFGGFKRELNSHFFRKKGKKTMNEYIKEIEQIAAKCTESQSDGYSQIMRICDAMREQQKSCLGYISKEEIASPQFD